MEEVLSPCTYQAINNQKNLDLAPFLQPSIPECYLKQQIELDEQSRAQGSGIYPQAIVPYKSSHERRSPSKRVPYFSAKIVAKS